MAIATPRRLKDWGANYIDYRSAWISALLLGVIVWTINLPHGALAALPAALKQATYTFFVAGFIVRLCENLAVRIRARQVALCLATLIPASAAIGLTYLVHSLRGTPEPFQSTLPTMLIAPPTMFWWGKRTRTEAEGTDK